ncbi:MAG: hypothetical protein EOO67_11675 [Microbacterium sp.]|nr:MAG: hypothetical protein EOO67_11675 [Microbacterium sp.]
MAEKYLTLRETLLRFARTVPLLVAMIAGVVVYFRWSEGDWHSAPLLIGCAVMITPAAWLKWFGTRDKPMADPTAWGLAAAWIGLCLLVMYLVVD